MNSNAQITLRRSGDRGHAQHGWLDARHSFSFAEYFDPDHMGFRALRVMNEDRIAGGGGFGEHPHDNMEIVTIVLEGALQHRDSLGSGSVIGPGDVQVMTAGNGIRHSEFNASKDETCHLLQIWLLPEKSGTEPRYGEKHFDDAELEGQLRRVVSGDGRDGSLQIGRDVSLLRGRVAAGQSVVQPVADGRHAWVQVVSGSIDLLGRELATGDGAALSDTRELDIRGLGASSEVLVFDLD